MTSHTPSHSLTIRIRIDRKPGALARAASTIGESEGLIGAIPIVKIEKEHVIRDFDIYVGKAMEVKVVKINYANNNVVVSHKVLIEKDIEEQKAAILRNLEKGQVLEGTIKNMTNFGVFIDLGGVDGLLQQRELDRERLRERAGDAAHETIGERPVASHFVVTDEEIRVEIRQPSAGRPPGDGARDDVVVFAALEEGELAVGFPHDLDEGQARFVERMLQRIGQRLAAEGDGLAHMAAGQGGQQIIDDDGIRLWIETHRILR